MFNTMGSQASPGVLDLGLGNVTTDQLQKQMQERRKKKMLAAGNTNPGAYGDASMSPATALLFGLS